MWVFLQVLAVASSYSSQVHTGATVSIRGCLSLGYHGDGLATSPHLALRFHVGQSSAPCNHLQDKWVLLMDGD